MILFILAILILYIYIIIININHGKSRSLTLIPGYDHFLILPFMYILGIIVLGNSINQPLFWYSKWQCSFSFLSQHVTVFFSGKTCSWKPYSTMVTIYVSCNYLSQFLTVHCVTNYGNTQCFPVNNPWNQSIDFLTKETCCLMVSAILPIWYIHGRYGRILYIYDISIDTTNILPLYSIGDVDQNGGENCGVWPEALEMAVWVEEPGAI